MTFGYDVEALVSTLFDDEFVKDLLRQLSWKRRSVSSFPVFSLYSHTNASHSLKKMVGR